jgi:hypothetical protein
MSRFISGVVLGCFLGIVGSTLAASISGTGTLDGWTVLDEEGDTICSDPKVDAGNKELQCDAIGKRPMSLSDTCRRCLRHRD